MKLSHALLRRILIGTCALLLLAPRTALADDNLSLVLAKRTPTLMNTLNLVADGAGFYKDEHLTISRITVAGALEAAQTCASGTGDICPIGIEPLITNYPDGIHLKMFLSRASRFAYVIAVPEASPIKSLADFKGQRIGVHVITAAASGVFTTASALSAAGLKPNEYTFEAIGYENEAANAMTSGKVAGAAFPVYEFIPFIVAGMKFRFFRHPTFASVSNVGYAASPSVLAAKHDSIARFSRAIVKASLYIRYNPAAAARLLLKATGEPFSEDDVRRKTAELTAWEDDLPASDAANKRIGALSVTALQGYVQLLADAGVAKVAIPSSEIATEEFVAFANDFDHKQVKKRAMGQR
ncbi:MAG: ABC transporter substrate-binding protein [Variovorax sp.]